MSTQLLVDRFELKKQLSETDVSSVYLGCDRQYLQRPSCVITAIHYSQREMRHRLEREARVIEQLGHSPQIPSVLAYFHQVAGEQGSITKDHQVRSQTTSPPAASATSASLAQPSSSESRRTFYLVQSHVLGHSLSKEITPGKKLRESYVVKLLQDVLVALCSVHRQGKVHQNLHPQNLIRQDIDGQIFLTEFGGLARLARSELGADGTLQVTMPVSPNPYLAPEQLQPDYAANPTPASDLYSLGLIAIEALIGRPHYDLAYDPNKGLLWREGVDVSLTLAEFIDRLVRHSPEDRFEDAAEALEALRLGRERYQVAHDSRLNTVVAAPGGGANRFTTTGSGFGGQGTRSGTTSLSATGRTYPLKAANPYLFKLFAGGIAVAIALGVGVKTFQWGQHRLTQLPQTWEDWGAERASYPEAKASELVPLLQDGSILLRPAAAQAFWEMDAAAKADDIDLYALAGYRAQDAAPAGAEAADNDYPTGYAISVGGAQASQDWQQSFAQSEAFEWLTTHAKDHGFELSVTERGLLGETSPEPWHWRYVGDAESKSIFGQSTA